MDSIFTGLPELDITILLNLPIAELDNICQVNKYAKKLCENEHLIMKRFNQRKQLKLEYPKNIRKTIVFKFINENVFEIVPPEMIEDNDYDDVMLWISFFPPAISYKAFVNNIIVNNIIFKNISYDTLINTVADIYYFYPNNKVMRTH